MEENNEDAKEEKIESNEKENVSNENDLETKSKKHIEKNIKKTEKQKIKKSKKQEIKKDKKKHRGLKVLLIIISIVLIIALILVGGFFYLKNNLETDMKKIVIHQEETFEYGSSISYEDLRKKLINNSSSDIIVNIYIDNILIDESDEYKFDQVKDLDITIESSSKIVPFIDYEIKLKDNVIWKVQDTKFPVLSGIEDKEITQGDEFDPKAGITAADEIDGDLEVTIEGEYDVNTVGEYTLKAKAVDKNNNETSQDFKLTVKEKTEEQPSSSGNNSRPSTNSESSGSSSSNSGSSSSSGTSSSSGSSSSSSSSSGNTGSSGSSSGGSSGRLEDTKEGRLTLARQEAQRVVSRIITPGMSNYAKAEAICMYITNTVSVQSDQSNEAYKTNYGNEAYAALIMKIAACSGRCKAVTLLCDAAGLQSQHINQNQWSHQWNKILMEDGTWIVIDSQIGFIGDKHPLED